jgi:NAD(P)-dependent dehydrogenase (short-subunit alcohol dehydrogenase family)
LSIAPRKEIAGRDLTFASGRKLTGERLRFCLAFIERLLELPHFRKSPAPAIVFVGSLAGVVGYARKSAYSTTKGALITMSRQLALEWAVDNIRVNVLIPGTIDSPLFRKMVRPEVLATFERATPMGRLGLASEMADLAIFLASPAASFITGQTINCCGGFSINTFVVPAGMTETLIEARQRERDAAANQ